MTPKDATRVRGSAAPTALRRYAAMDGYRGLFVGLVIAYHFGVTELVGGWVGINHFFVFSGFLISRILIKERQKYGRIDIMRFYQRRARRVLPAMFVLVAAVLVHSWLFTEAQQKREFAGDAFATLGFFLNWRLIARQDSYFDQFGNPSPLRHAWTLSVEEQFYVLVPFLILALVMMTRSRNLRFAIAMALATVSAWWTAHLGYHSIEDQARLYYGTDTRAQALLVGVAFGFLFGVDDRGRPPRLPSRSVTTALGALGTIVSVSAVFFLDADTGWVYNSGGVLLFALGASLMGWSSIDPRDLLINRIFGWEPLAFLGRISYGLYLYHWPVGLWLHVPGPRLVEGSVQFAVTFVVACASWRWLEGPVLARGLRGLMPGWPASRRRLAALAAAACLAVTSGTLWATTPASSFPDRVAEIPKLAPGQPPYRPPMAPTRVALLGDSVPDKLAEYFPRHNFPGLTPVDLGVPGCDLLDAPSIGQTGQIVPNAKNCSSAKANVTADVRREGVDTVVVFPGLQLAFRHEMAGRQMWLDDAAYDKAIRDALSRMVARARAGGAARVMVATVPCRRIQDFALPNGDREQMRHDADVAAQIERPTRVNDLVRDWARAAKVPVIDLAGPLCRTPQPSSINGQRLYEDGVHFSPEASPMVWGWLAWQLLPPSRGRG